MTAGTLKAQLAELIRLQQEDKAIHDLNVEKQTKPEEIARLTEEFEAKKQSLADAEKKLLDIQKQKKEGELNLASQEENARKLQSQLYSLKTNKEYQAMLGQIQDAKADASVIEDKILGLMDEVETARKAVDEEKARLKEHEQVFNEAKRKIEERIKAIDGEIAQHEAKRKQIAPAVDARILAQYDRILQGRNGLAMVPVQEYSCTGCFMRVTPQIVNEIKMYDQLITCQACNRILYIEE